MRVRAGEVEIEVEADAGRGEPLVLLMGIGAQLVLWPKGFCDELRSRGFRLVLLDNRDVGLSTHLSHLPVPNVGRVIARTALGLPIAAPYTLGEMADDVVAVLDALGVQRAHVVGASMGGMIAQTFAIRHRARTATLTSIMSTTGDRRYALLTRPAALRVLLGKPPKTREEGIARTMASFQAIGSRTHPRDLDLLRDMAERSFDRGVNPAGFARQWAAICASGSRARALRDLDLPALVIHGGQDPLIAPAAGRATAHAIPNATLLELGDMGHDLPRPLWPTIASAIRANASRASIAAPR